MIKGNLRLGLVTYQLAQNWDISTIVERCQQTGWEAVELRTQHKHGVEPEMDSSERVRVRQAFAESGVKLLSLGSTCEYHSADKLELEAQINRTKQFLQLAADVGAAAVKVRPNGLQTRAGIAEEVTLRQIGEALAVCGDTAADLGVELWLEVHGPETNHPDRIATIMEIANHRAVGVCWNSTPPDIKNGSVESSFQLLRPWVKVLHIHELWDPEYPYGELFAVAVASGFDGYALAEIPESSEPIRLMRYYKALFDALKKG